MNENKENNLLNLSKKYRNQENTDKLKNMVSYITPEKKGKINNDTTTFKNYSLCN